MTLQQSSVPQSVGTYSPPPSTPPAEDATAQLPRWKRVLFSLILFAIVAALLEGMASLYLRVTQGYDGTHLYQYEFDPYKNILPARGFVDVRGVRHNQQGFRRSTPVAFQKPPGTYRIFLMGASTAYGLGGLWTHIEDRYPVLTNEQTIDHYLERQLQERFPGTKIEVVNAAITSTWTHHSLIYLNQSILKFRPDMVLFLDGFNDYWFSNPHHDQFESYAYNMPSRSILGPPTVGSLAHAVGWWFFRTSAFVHVVGRVAKNVKLFLAPRLAEQRPIDVDRTYESFTRVFSENALKMHRRSGLILRDEGVVPVFMLQPMLILERDKPKPEAEQRLFDFNVSSYEPNYEQFVVRAAEYARARERAMAEDVGGHYIDLTTIFRDQPGQMYTDYAHLTPEANELLARTVTSRIAPLVEAGIAGRCASAPAGDAACPAGATR